MLTSTVFKGALIVKLWHSESSQGPHFWETRGHTHVLRGTHLSLTHLRGTRKCRGTAPPLVARLCENTTIKMLYLSHLIKPLDVVNNVSNSCWGAGGSDAYFSEGTMETPRGGQPVHGHRQWWAELGF